MFAHELARPRGGGYPFGPLCAGTCVPRGCIGTGPPLAGTGYEPSPTGIALGTTMNFHRRFDELSLSKKVISIGKRALYQKGYFL